MANLNLTVKKINGATRASFEQLFNSDLMQEVRAEGTDTLFNYNGKEYVVEETFSEVQNLLEVPLAGLHVLWAKFDATGGKAIGSHNLVDPVSGEAIVLPDDAIIVDGGYFVDTTFTSATDAATIALGVATDAAAGLKAAIAISNGANPYDSGAAAKALIPVGTVATHVAKTTAERALIATVATEALTAGVLLVCVQYIVKPV